MKNIVSFNDFQKIDIRNGKILSIENFPEGQYSSHILIIDFGKEIGEKKSLARLSPNYEGPELLNKQIMAIVNLPPKQIGKHLSEVLVLGVSDDNGNVLLVEPHQGTPLGGQLH